MPETQRPTAAAIRTRRGRLPLVGRDRELALLRGLITGAQASAGQMLFLSGESGVGKTRLVEALGDDAAAAGCRMLVGHAYPAEGSFPFALAADALSQLVRALGPSAVTLLSRGHEHDLAMILPTLARPGAGDAAQAADSDAKGRVFWHLERFVRRAAEQQPIILVLENVQWADASSLELLHFLVRQLAGAKLSALCTYNSLEREVTPALRAAERSLVRAGRAERHELGPLSRDDVGELVRQSRASGSAVPDSFADLLYNRTLGNPFFVEELLAAATAAAGGHTGEWSLDAEPLPGSIRDAVLARADELDPAVRKLLDCVAAMGMRAPQAVLAKVSGASADELTESIGTLGARGLIVEHADEAGVWYDCDHPIVQATLYEALGRTGAQALHARIADAFESLQPQGGSAHVNEIAWHYSRAGDASPTPKAMRFLALAGRNALARHADREAATLLQACLARTPSGEGGLSSADRAQLLDDLARARQRLGEYDAAYSLWSEARRNAVLPADAEFVSRIERRMGLSAYWSGRPLDAIGHYDAAIAIARPSGVVGQVVRTLISRATALRAVGDLAAARTSVEEALSLAKTTGDHSLLARAHRALLLTYAWTGPASAAREHAAQALAFAESSGDRAVAWSAHWAMAVLAGITGDAEGTAHHTVEADRIATELGSPVLAAWTSEIAVEYASGVGDWTNGLALADRAIPVARAVAPRTLLPRLLVWKGLILLARDEIEAAKACIDESWELSGADAPERPGADLHAIIPAHTGRAAYHIAMRDNASAIRIGERGLALADHHGYLAWAIHRLLPVLVEAALWSRDYSRASAYAARLRAGGATLDHRLAIAWADGADALVLRLRDNDPGAAAALLRAADNLERVPFVYHAARVRRNAAQVLAANGDRERAIAELRTAHDMFRRMGAVRELRGTREEIRALGARPPQRATPAEGALTVREQEIARLLADRKTNRAIGTALDISPRTVSTHLANIFQKLGIDSRGALIDLVRADPSLIAEMPDES